VSEKVFVSTVSAGGIRKILKAIKFILISYVVSLILIAILSCLVVYTGLPEKHAPIGVNIITYFSCFLSGLMTARGSNSKGWLLGTVSGALNILILTLISMAVMGTAANGVGFVLKIIIAAACGAVGGIIGININRD